MPLSVKLSIDKDNRKVFTQIQNAPNATMQGIRRAFYFIGKDLTKTARRSIIDPPKTGRVYKRTTKSGRRRRHRASAPGEPPANMTGTLQKSINFLVKGSDQLEFGANAEYAGFLELGTRKMAKREYLIRAIENRQKNTRNFFEKEIEKRVTK